MTSTRLSLSSGVEGGTDVQLGWRGDRIGKTPLQPYAFAAVNTAGETHYAAAGISAKFGDRIFIRPGLGIAVHTGSAANFEDPDNGKIDFGSRVLFEPELGHRRPDQRSDDDRGQLGAHEPLLSCSGSRTPAWTISAFACRSALIRGSG